MALCTVYGPCHSRAGRSPAVFLCIALARPESAHLPLSAGAQAAVLIRLTVCRK